MLQLAFADRLMEACNRNGESIVKQWFTDLSANERTVSFRSIPKEECLRFGVFFYKSLSRMYFAEHPYQEVALMLDVSRYAETKYAQNIPLDDLIYSLILLRRHIWLFAASQALFNSSLDMYQAVESINRVLLLFDYAIHIVTRTYLDLDEQYQIRSLKRGLYEHRII